MRRGYSFELRVKNRLGGTFGVRRGGFALGRSHSTCMSNWGLAGADPLSDKLNFSQIEFRGFLSVGAYTGMGWITLPFQHTRRIFHGNLSESSDPDLRRQAHRFLPHRPLRRGRRRCDRGGVEVKIGLSRLVKPSQIGRGLLVLFAACGMRQNMV